jgi:hypothetical protein
MRDGRRKKGKGDKGDLVGKRRRRENDGKGERRT